MNIISCSPGSHSHSDTEVSKMEDKHKTTVDAPMKEPLLFKISKQIDKRDSTAGGTHARLDKVEKTLDKLLDLFTKDPPQRLGQHPSENTPPVVDDLNLESGTDHTNLYDDQDYVSLLPTDEGEYDTDSSAIRQEEEERNRRKRTSKERILQNSLDRDVNDLTQAKVPRLNANATQSSSLDKFDTPSIQDTGEPIADNLHKKICKYWDLDQEGQLDIIRGNYKIPENTMDRLTVPQINTQVYRKIKPYVKRIDSDIKSVQMNICQATAALLKITETVLDAEKNNVPIKGNEVLKHSLNAYAMLGNSKRFLTNHRRKTMSNTKGFPPLLKEVCNGEIPPNSKNIFGDDIQTSLKEAQDRIQLNKQLSVNNTRPTYSKRPVNSGRNVHFQTSNPVRSSASASGYNPNYRPPYSSNTQTRSQQQDFRQGHAPRGRQKGGPKFKRN